MEKEAIDHTQTVVIATDGLTKTFAHLKAVNQLNLEVRCGDAFGFLGPNGAGKTTTIRMLLGLIRPAAGRIEVFGLNNAACGCATRGLGSRWKHRRRCGNASIA